MSWASNHIANLQQGLIVKFSPSGNSMSGIIESGQPVVVAPLSETFQPEVGDVVLCKVNGKQYLHKISAVKHGQFQISNNKNFCNGWTKTIYGIAIEVNGKFLPANKRYETPGE